MELIIDLDECCYLKISQIRFDEKVKLRSGLKTFVPGLNKIEFLI